MSKDDKDITEEQTEQNTPPSGEESPLEGDEQNAVEAEAIEEAEEPEAELIEADDDGAKDAEESETARQLRAVIASLNPKDLLPMKPPPPDKVGVIGVYRKPVFPHMGVPLVVEGRRLIKAIEHATKHNNDYIGIFLIRDSFTPESPGVEDFEEVGVLAEIMRFHKVGNKSGAYNVFLQSHGRIRRRQTLSESPRILVQIEHLEDEQAEITEEVIAYCREIRSDMQELHRLVPNFKEEIGMFVANVNEKDPGRLADFAASLTNADRNEIQTILACLNVPERLSKTLFLIKKELDLSRLQAKLSKQIEDRINKSQRDFFLREQLKEIRKELGMSHDGKDHHVKRYEAKLKKSNMPPEVLGVFNEELERFSMLDPQSSEYNVTKTYLDWLACLPWGVYQKENRDIAKAQQRLDRDHYGLEDVKEHIVEFIATMTLKEKLTGSILCLVGPPGVGKTSVGKSVAAALNRPFYRFSLGAMRDEAEIKGHRRTYIGAMPGKLIQALKVTKKSNPVILLDEIDKVGDNYRSDPSGALLEVLDPEQNANFMDHYLDVPYDLSNVLFICTANQLDTISAPLLDRMEVIELSGYITNEKIEIAKKYLIPKQRKNHGLTGRTLRISDAAVLKIIEDYARESGVRKLEQMIKKICRKIAVEIVSGKTPPKMITPKHLKAYLKTPIFEDDDIAALAPGCVNGLAWTSYGGAILTIESICMESEKKGLKHSGKLGEVMVESTELAYSYVLSNASTYQGDPEFFKKNFVHLHVPAGATPKDGPSAGVTMATSLISLMNATPVKDKLGMTGELTLTGKVLRIGGLREKILAAKRMGLQEVIIPAANRNDWQELPEHLQEGITCHLVKHYDEVFAIAFPQSKPQTKA